MKALQDRISYQFRDEGLLLSALTHKSFIYDHKLSDVSYESYNERLEFLGDAILGLAIASELMKRFPEDNEGILSKKRAVLVGECSLASLAENELELHNILRIGEGERRLRSHYNSRVLSCAFEALIGAIFRDADYSSAERVVCWLFSVRLSLLQQGFENYDQDMKTRLQEYFQSRFHRTPVYTVVGMEGPDHQKSFRVQVLFDGELLGTGIGPSKKRAEQSAAKEALSMLTGLDEEQND